MSKEFKGVVIERVPLENLLDSLLYLYNSGVDFIDLEVLPDEGKVALLFNEEYMNEEYSFDALVDEDPIHIDIKEEDLNDLI